MESTETDGTGTERMGWNGEVCNGSQRLAVDGIGLAGQARLAVECRAGNCIGVKSRGMAGLAWLGLNRNGWDRIAKERLEWT